MDYGIKAFLSLFLFTLNTTIFAADYFSCSTTVCDATDCRIDPSYRQSFDHAKLNQACDASAQHACSGGAVVSRCLQISGCRTLATGTYDSPIGVIDPVNNKYASQCRFEYSPSDVRFHDVISTYQEVKTCPVAPFTRLTDRPSLNFEAGNFIYTAAPEFKLQTELACVRSAVTAAGGSSVLVSAYRPQKYQEHLREVWDKWDALENDNTPECAALKAEAKMEWDRHGLGDEPTLGVSNHTRGRAFDLTIFGISSAQKDSIGQSCGNLIRFDPINDPAHFAK